MMKYDDYLPFRGKEITNINDLVPGKKYFAEERREPKYRDVFKGVYNKVHISGFGDDFAIFDKIEYVVNPFGREALADGFAPSHYNFFEDDYDEKQANEGVDNMILALTGSRTKEAKDKDGNVVPSRSRGIPLDMATMMAIQQFDPKGLSKKYKKITSRKHHTITNKKGGKQRKTRKTKKQKKTRRQN